MKNFFSRMMSRFLSARRISIQLLRLKKCGLVILTAILSLLFLLFKILVITDIHNWDSNTSLDLHVYIKPNQSTTLIHPKIHLRSQRWKTYSMFSVHSVENWSFFCPWNFTWNQLWVAKFDKNWFHVKSNWQKILKFPHTCLYMIISCFFNALWAPNSFKRGVLA